MTEGHAVTTPETSLAAILRDGRTPLIGDVVDLDRFPWVSPDSWIMATPYGDVPILCGMLSDGASGPVLRWRGRRLDLIPDLDPRAWFPHDRLYQHPYVRIRYARRRIGFVTANRIYGWTLRHYGWPVRGTVRALTLHVLGIPAWRRYRTQERRTPNADLTPMVPMAHCWRFGATELSWHTRDAVWAPSRPLDRTR